MFSQIKSNEIKYGLEIIDFFSSISRFCYDFLGRLEKWSEQQLLLGFHFNCPKVFPWKTSIVRKPFRRKIRLSESLLTKNYNSPKVFLTKIVRLVLKC